MTTQPAPLTDHELAVLEAFVGAGFYHEVSWPVGEAMVPVGDLLRRLASEVRRLRRENHLLTLSRGMPSTVQGRD